MNQRRLRIAVWLCMALLWICAIPTGSQAATNEQIILQVEEPGSGSVYSGVGNIRGWAVAPQGIQRIELAIDGVYRTNIPSGGLRTDVGNAYPTYPNADESGFSMAFNYSNMAFGPHTISVRAVNANGNDRAATVTFNVTRFDNPYISNPSGVSLSGSTVRDEGESILIDNLLVEGKRYDVRLGWRPAVQGFSVTQITSAGTLFDLTGTWEGTARSSVYSDTHSFTVYLIQEGSTLRGSLTVLNNPRLTNANLTGNVSGNTMTCEVTGVVQFTGTVSPDGNTISGSFVSTDPDAYDSGTWQATRIQ